jgi:hypothetical protein
MAGIDDNRQRVSMDDWKQVMFYRALEGGQAFIRTARIGWLGIRNQ